LAAILVAAFPLSAIAELQSVTESATYAMSETDSRSEARQKCAESAKRTALDRAGSVFEAQVTTDKSEKGGKVADDTQIKMKSTLAAVVSSEMVASQMDVFGETTRMSCEVKITYDPDSVTQKMHQLADAEGLRKQVAAQQMTIAQLQDAARQPPPPAAAPVIPVTASPLLAATPQFAPPPVAATPQFAPPPAAPTPQFAPPPVMQTAEAYPAPPPASAPAQRYYLPPANAVPYSPPAATAPRIYTVPTTVPAYLPPAGAVAMQRSYIQPVAGYVLRYQRGRLRQFRVY
jgi:hypothetical protein